MRPRCGRERRGQAARAWPRPPKLSSAASLRANHQARRHDGEPQSWPCRSNPLLMPRRLVAGHRRSGDCHHRLWSGRATPTLVPPTTCADLTPPSANRSTSKSRTSGSTSTRPNRRANLKVVKTQSIGEVDYIAEGGIACHTHSLVGAPRVIDWRALSEAQGCTRVGWPSSDAWAPARATVDEQTPAETRQCIVVLRSHPASFPSSGCHGLVLGRIAEGWKRNPAASQNYLPECQLAAQTNDNADHRANDSACKTPTGSHLILKSSIIWGVSGSRCRRSCWRRIPCSFPRNWCASYFVKQSHILPTSGFVWLIATLR